jgi:predicted cation transporter
MGFAEVANLVVLLIVLAGPFAERRIEHNLEAFLFVMGLLSALSSRVLTATLIGEALSHPIPITIAVLISGMVFTRARRTLDVAVTWLAVRIGQSLLVAIISVVLGLASSIITAIIAALVLVEIMAALRLERGAMVRSVIVACYAIGLGAALTPIGEPLSTIAVAKLNQDFWYLIGLLGPYVIPGVAGFGVMAVFLRTSRGLAAEALPADPPETLHQVVARAGRVYLFVMALTLLGEGFKPLIDRFVIGLDARFLYWINMVSAILDNATLTAARSARA